MDRQSTIAFLLIGIVVIAWIVMTSPTQPPQKKKAQTVQVQDTIKKQEAPAPQAQQAEQTITPDTSSVSKLFAKMNTAENIITVDNKFVRFQLTNKGGKIKRAYLKNYKNWYTDAKKKDLDVYQDNIQLLDTYRGGTFDVEITTIPDRKLISTRDLEFKPSTTQSSIVVKDNDSVSLSYEYVNAANQKITRTYTFYGDRYDTWFGTAVSVVLKPIHTMKPTPLTPVFTWAVNRKN